MTDIIIDKFIRHYLRINNKTIQNFNIKDFFDSSLIVSIYRNVCIITDENIDIDYIKNRFVTLKFNENKLIKLKQIPVIEQRSQEWYETRNGLITASDMAQALGKGKFGTQKDFFININCCHPRNNYPMFGTFIMLL